jgi:hypothetical protein
MIAHLAFPAITLGAIAAELGRELEQRRGFYPGRVTKGNMLQEEADRELALAAAWREDCARIAAAWGAGAAPLPAAHPFTWRDRREGLQRELELRERFYPGWIAGGRLLAGQAAHRTACLQALLAIYEDGWDWRGSDGLTPRSSAIAAEEYRQLRADVDAREGRAQNQLALT